MAAEALERRAEERRLEQLPAEERRAAERRAEPLAPHSEYRELAPPAALAPTLVCSWFQVIGDSDTAYSQRVLPDGCIDLVCIGDAPPVAVGPATRTAIASLPPGIDIVGVRFRPGAAPGALGVPASELLDGTVALREVWGRAADDLHGRVGEARTIEARLAALQQALLARGPRDTDPMASAAVAWLARNPSARIESLARSLVVSPRQLQRRFAAAVGYGPKTFQRIARFQRLLALARARHTLTELALAAGYADQAHMTREVVELAGRTPSRVLGSAGSSLLMSDLFELG